MNWFLVKSPFQFLSAIEARAAYGVRHEDACLVVFKPDGGAPAERQLGALTERFPWPQTSTPKHVEGDRINNPRSRAFVGDYREPGMRRLARTLSSARPIVLDDGNATLLIAQRRERNLWRWTDRRATRITDAAHGRRFAVPQILRDVLRPAYREFSSVEFFSIYPIRGGQHDTVQRNHLSVLRSMVPDRTTRRPVFVGSSLVESGIMQASDYRECVKRAAHNYPDTLYIAHRREDDSKLRDLAENVGIEILRPKFPIEVELIDRGLEPTPLVVVLSTAADTVPIVFPTVEVVDLVPSLDAIAPSNRDIIARMIALQSSGRPGDPTPTR